MTAVLILASLLLFAAGGWCTAQYFKELQAGTGFMVKQPPAGVKLRTKTSVKARQQINRQPNYDKLNKLKLAQIVLYILGAAAFLAAIMRWAINSVE